MDNRKIYIVDDSADYSFLIQQIFYKFLPEYEADFFTGGDTLLQQLHSPSDQKKDELPALVLLDLNMPGISGYQTLKLLKAPNDPDFEFVKQIPVIMMSNEGSTDQIAECYKAGANACLKKPIEFNQLKELLKSVCYFWMHVNRGPILSSK